MEQHYLHPIYWFLAEIFPEKPITNMKVTCIEESGFMAFGFESNQKIIFRTSIEIDKKLLIQLSTTFEINNFILRDENKSLLADYILKQVKRFILPLAGIKLMESVQN